MRKFECFAIIVLGVLFATVVGCDQFNESVDAASSSAVDQQDAGADGASTPPTIVPFEEEGVIIAVRGFFDSQGMSSEYALGDGDVAGRMLITRNGVFSFIETPENQAQVGSLTNGTAVRISGKLHNPGRLLHVDSLEVLDKQPEVELSTYSGDPGQPVTLSGVNKCQCGIKIAELKTSCDLGHLHHLEGDDGKLYHYVPNDQGEALHKGQGTHFKKVEVKGRLLPGQFVLVDAIEVK